MRAGLSQPFLEQMLAFDSSLELLAQAKTERYQYVPLRGLEDLARASVDSAAKKGAEWNHDQDLVLAGGMLLRKQLPTSVECWPLDQARRLLGVSLQRRLDQAAEQEPDLMAQLAKRHAPQPLVLYVPPRTELPDAIRIALIGPEQGWSLQRLIVIVGAQASCCFEVEQISQGYTASCWEIWQEEGSSCTVAQLDEAASSWAFTALRTELKRHARFCWRGGSLGGKTVRWDLAVRLLQEGAETDLSGFWNLRAGAQVHSHVHVEHVAPNCRSNQLFKGINDQGAVSSFAGLIQVRREAQQTNAYQLNQNLLVHPSAKAFSKPSLDILADDVRATHGSTTGRLDPEQLFYLVSRGIPRDEAKRLLTRAFCETLLRDLPSAWHGRLAAT